MMLQTIILVTAATISLVAGLALVGAAFRRMCHKTQARTPLPHVSVREVIGVRALFTQFPYYKNIPPPAVWSPDCPH
jgi:hypothetical protein